MNGQTQTETMELQFRETVPLRQRGDEATSLYKYLVQIKWAKI